MTQTETSKATLTQDDLRQAVAAGIVTESQAAALTMMAHTRAGYRAGLASRDEPFELFKGFNEVFIVVGLVILYSGWLGVTGLSWLMFTGPEGLPTLVLSMVAMGLLSLAARYFTLKRRMVAPSIALTVMFAISALQTGDAIGWGLDIALAERISLAFGLATLLVIGWYLVFRIPFSMALVSVGVLVAVGALFVVQGATMPSPEDLFLLSNDGPFAWIIFVLGIAGLILAMGFDMSDPYRVSRLSMSGFWLHVIAAPAIANTVALTLLEKGTAASYVLILVFVAALALFAVIVDRRSFLVSGIGYVVALALLLLDGAAAIAILLLGLGLIVLGALWQRLRSSLMRRLPDFPGKTRLPPYADAAPTGAIPPKGPA